MKRSLLALFLLAVVVVLNSCASAPGSTATSILSPKLVWLSHQLYEHKMQKAVALGWPAPLNFNGTTPQGVETFPDPAGTGNVSYEVTIKNVTNEGITFSVVLTQG